MWIHFSRLKCLNYDEFWILFSGKKHPNIILKCRSTSYCPQKPHKVHWASVRLGQSFMNEFVFRCCGYFLFCYMSGSLVVMPLMICITLEVWTQAFSYLRFLIVIELSLQHNKSVKFPCMSKFLFLCRGRPTLHDMTRQLPATRHETWQ